MALYLHLQAILGSLLSPHNNIFGNWHIAYTSRKRLGRYLDINLRIILFSRLLCGLLKKIFGKMGEMAVTNN
jgi:hypothetical protein